MFRLFWGCNKKYCHWKSVTESIFYILCALWRWGARSALGRHVKAKHVKDVAQDMAKDVAQDVALEVLGAVDRGGRKRKGAYLGHRHLPAADSTPNTRVPPTPALR